jgi:hypothetical protein
MSVLKDECGKDVAIVDRNELGGYIVRFQVHGLWFDISSVCNQHNDLMYQRCIEKAMLQLEWYAGSDDVLNRRAALQIKSITTAPIPPEIGSTVMSVLSMWREFQRSGR